MSALRYFLLSLALALTASAQQPLVVVTNAVLRDIVSHVGGDVIRIETLVPDGVETTDYEPSEADRDKLADAIAVVSNGAGLEPWLDDLLAKARYAGSQIVVTDDLKLLDLDGNPYVEGGPATLNQPDPDPYAWHDPLAVDVYAENLRAALKTLLPTKRVAIDANANAFKEELASAHQYALEQIARIAPANRRLITSYDCFGYFAKAYGFSIRRVPGVAGGSAIRPAVLDRLYAIISPLRPKAVFYERGANPTSLRELSGALGVPVNASLYGHFLGAEHTPAETYIGMFRANVDTIVTALADPPPAPAVAGGKK